MSIIKRNLEDAANNVMDVYFKSFSDNKNTNRNIKEIIKIPYQEFEQYYKDNRKILKDKKSKKRLTKLNKIYETLEQRIYETIEAMEKEKKKSNLDEAQKIKNKIEETIEKINKENINNLDSIEKIQETHINYINKELENYYIKNFLAEEEKRKLKNQIIEIQNRMKARKEELENQELKDAKTKIENKGQRIANFILDTYCENKTKENEEKLGEKMKKLEKTYEEIKKKSKPENIKKLKQIYDTVLENIKSFMPNEEKKIKTADENTIKTLKKENEEKEIEEKILALEKEKIRSEIFEIVPQMKTMLDLLNEITDESKSKTLEQVEELYQKFCEIKNSKDTAKTVDKLRPKIENPLYKLTFRNLVDKLKALEGRLVKPKIEKLKKEEQEKIKMPEKVKEIKKKIETAKNIREELKERETALNEVLRQKEFIIYNMDKFVREYKNYKDGKDENYEDSEDFIKSIQISIHRLKMVPLEKIARQQNNTTDEIKNSLEKMKKILEENDDLLTTSYKKRYTKLINFLEQNTGVLNNVEEN